MPIRRMISTVPAPSAVARAMMQARQASLRGVLRSVRQSFKLGAVGGPNPLSGAEQ
jgi:hypothetical protein